MADPHDDERGTYRKTRSGVHRITPRTGSRFTERANKPKDRAVQQASKDASKPPLDLYDRRAHMAVFNEDFRNAPDGQKPNYDAHYDNWLQNR